MVGQRPENGSVGDSVPPAAGLCSKYDIATFGMLSLVPILVRFVLKLRALF